MEPARKPKKSVIVVYTVLMQSSYLSGTYFAPFKIAELKMFFVLNLCLESEILNIGKLPSFPPVVPLQQTERDLCS